MGDFTLGCLLGQYDRAQSFDVASKSLLGAASINSWGFGVGSGQLNASEVHSSAQGLHWDTGSRSTATVMVNYDHRAQDDAYGRWFPDITTHLIRIDFWARVGGGGDDARQDFNGIPGDLQTDITYSAGIRAFRNSNTNVTSGTNGPVVRFVRNTPANGNTAFYLDDVLTQIDPITLHPDYEFVEQARLIKAEHRTLGGDLHSYLWAHHRAWTAPLRFLPSSHADLINWWWQNQFNLALTLDTSDSESIHIVRIVNDRQPIGRRVQPYNDLWQGTVELESINPGQLVF